MGFDGILSRMLRVLCDALPFVNYLSEMNNNSAEQKCIRDECRFIVGISFSVHDHANFIFRFEKRETNT